MQRSSIRMRPRYSLRLLLVCVTMLTVAVAVYRGPLRRQLGKLKEQWAALWADETKLVDRILIIGPQTTGMPVALDPPRPDEIVQALNEAGALSKTPPNLRMVIEPVADYADPPRVYPLIGQAQLHHAHYKCLLFSDDGENTVYVDHNHLCVP